ncbi:MAG: hypothetical protein D6736_01180 [Nitrospinota bacterium]|nr:MAG: hypothetical protein D6736_01180 [Nitrospinota bacterium]
MRTAMQGVIRYHRSISVLLLFLSLAAFSHAQGATTIALLPFENVSGNLQSLRIIMPLIAQHLQAKGYHVMQQDVLEPFLFRYRIRNTGMLSRRHLHALRQEWGVEQVMVGTVDLFFASSENPQWGLSARVLSTASGNILWAASSGLSGDDFTTILGLGTIHSGERLGQEVVKALLHSLPRAGEPFPSPRRRPSGGGLFGFKAGYRSPLLDTHPPRRVALLPLENASQRKGAGRILTDIFTTALFQQGRYQVIEPGEVQEALLSLKAMPYGGIDFKTLAGLQRRIGVDAVLLGTVYTYNEGLQKGATSSPEVALDMRMLQAKDGRILWFATHTRKGEDFQRILDWGKIRSIVPLALKMAQEMLETL